MLARILACVIAMCGGVSAFAAAPTFSGVNPHGVQRGTEATLRLTGTNLEDAEEVLLYDTGMEVLALQHPEKDDRKGREFDLRVRIADDCPIGTQRMRIRTRTGITEVQNLYVGPLPIVEEVENNGDFAAPQAISQGVTVHGRVDREDVDYYVVEAKKSQRLTAEVFAMRLGYSGGSTYFDPYVAIIDANRFELAASDDTALVWNDAVASIVVPEDGRYIVQIRDASYLGDGRAYYLLSIGQFPRPLGTIPAGGKPGETLTVTMLGDVAGPMTREVTLPTGPIDNKRFGLQVQDDHGVSPSNQPFRISDLDNTVEVEPNNSRETATPSATMGAYNGVIASPGDIDFFKFPVQKDVTYDVQVYARRIRSPLDAVVAVYRADNGGGLGSNDDRIGPDPQMDFKAPEDGECVVMVRDHLNNGGEHYTYRIEITTKSPSVSAQPIEFARYVQPNIEIPQGAGSGVVVNVTRNNFGGPVNFRCDNLPAGVRIECPENWRGDGQIPLIFYADATAPVGGHHCDVVTYLADANQPDLKIEGPLSQDMLMIRANNNDRVWEERITRMPLIVTEQLPFRCWIETPKIPIVRGGSYNLVVKCEKQAGWDEDIEVRLLHNPNGVNASGSAKIVKGQTETVIPMNAAGNAAAQTSMIAVRCIATVGNGRRECCTPFVPFTVEEEYVTFEFAQGAVNQGQAVPYVVTVKKRKDFEGEAEVKLVGLPANASAEPLKLTKETPELIFQVKAAADTPTGMNKNVFCQVLVPESGELIAHNLGTGVLRVDPPPPMPKEPAPMPETPAAPVAQAAPPARPLSRLEQLRLEQAERAKAEGGGE
ncbi:MAG: PPC domain-containing protein [Planctomycetaceae bacterium]